MSLMGHGHGFKSSLINIFLPELFSSVSILVSKGYLSDQDTVPLCDDNTGRWSKPVSGHFQMVDLIITEHCEFLEY